MRSRIGMGLLSAAALLLQVALTRVFSIAQFYHFAFLVVSLALLGFGASGSLLAIFPRLRDRQLCAWYALGFALTTVLAYLFVNHQPFDSYSIAWDRRQVYLLAGNLLGLAVPFTFAGALIGLLLSQEAHNAGQIYSANLLGSAAGAALAPLVIATVGSERAILLCAVLGTGAALILADSQRWIAVGTALALLAGTTLLSAFPNQLEIQPSPYKQLSLFRLNPDANITATRQNAYSRLDIVESTTIHSAQGKSLTHIGGPPPQIGLLIDGDELLPVPDTSRASDALAYSLPASVAFSVRPQAETLILGSGGGMDPWVALVNGSRKITVVEPNQLVYEVLTVGLRNWYGLADDPRVHFQHEEIRTFAQRADQHYDLVQLSLTDAYRPITAGAFTLTESYPLTVEAFEAYLDLCGDDGLLVLNRWLQTSPSESLRALALIIEALGNRNALEHVVVFRSYNLATFIIKPTPFSPEETTALLQAIERLRYDLVLAPEMPPEMINQYARLESPVYHDLFLELAAAGDREAFYDDYDFRIAPPTDDQPFFFHFFKWRQTPEVIENLGRKWQPFGGSGYFVLLALLGFAAVAALLFVLIPIALRRRFRRALAGSGLQMSGRVLG